MSTTHHRAGALSLCASLTLGALLLAQDAAACEDAAGAIAGFSAPQADDHHKLAALRTLSHGCTGDRSAQAEADILDVLVESVVRGFDHDLLREVFHAHQCLPQAGGLTGHDTVATLLDGARCPVPGEPAPVAENWYEVAVDAANIRSAPSVDSTRIGGATRGTRVQQLAVEGEWVRVETPQGIVGYIHGSLLTPYNGDRDARLPQRAAPSVAQAASTGNRLS
jgi:hypothetical protein